jgi:mannosyltransferase
VTITQALPRIDAEHISHRSPRPRPIAVHLWAYAMFFITGSVAAICVNSREMWADEYATVFAVHDTTWSQFWNLIQHQDLVHATYYAIMRPYVALVGDSPIALRAPSLLAMALAGAALPYLGRRLHSLSAGVVAAALFAATPSISRYGEEARSYAFITLTTILSFVLLLRAADKPQWRRWWLYGLSVVLLGLFNIITMLVVPAHLVLFWQQVRRQHGTIRPWRILGPLIVIVTLGPSFLQATAHQDAQVDWIRTNYGIHSLTSYLPNLFGSAPVAAAYAVLGLVFVGMYVRQRTPATSALLCWALVPPLALFVISVVHPLFYYRYLLYTVPAWCLIGGVAVSRAVPARWRAALAVVVVVAVAVAGYDGQVGARQSPVAGQGDYRLAARYVVPLVQQGDAVVYTYPTGFNDGARRALRYEMRGRRYADLDDALVTIPAVDTGYFGSVERTDYAVALHGVTRVWLIDNSYVHDATTQTPLGGFLASNYHLVSRRVFDGVRVYLFERKTP